MHRRDKIFMVCLAILIGILVILSACLAYTKGYDDGVRLEQKRQQEQEAYYKENPELFMGETVDLEKVGHRDTLSKRFTLVSRDRVATGSGLMTIVVIKDNESGDVLRFVASRNGYRPIN